MQGLLSFFLLIFLTMGLFAQEEAWYTEKPISEIRFEGLSAISENEFQGLVRPYIGEEYSDTVSWEIQSKLYALDYFDLIIPEIEATDSSNSHLILIFRVEEKPLVDEILFVGNAKIRRSLLLDAVLIKVDDMFNSGTLKLDQQALIDLYLDKGFLEAKVLVDDSGLDEETNKIRIIFSIIEGSQTKISEIRFVGNDAHVSDTTLIKLMETKPQSLFNKGLYIETKLQEDLKNIERYYNDQGFIDMSVANVEKTIILDEEENVKKMLLTIAIVEGVPWFYGGMSFEGNKIYTLQELEEQIRQNPGEVFRLSQFQTDYQRVTDMYFENGYIFNTFSYEEERNEERHEVFYAVQITERDRAHIENIIIRGNTKTKSYVIRREIPLEEGEVFSKTKILEGVMNLYNLQFFDVVEPQPYPGDSEGLMDLVVDLSEGKTSDISLGLSLSGGSDFPLSLLLNWNDRNFLGRGQGLGAKLNISRDIQKMELTFTEPRLFGLRWSGGFDLSYSHQLNRRINQDLDGNGYPDPYNTWAEYESTGRLIPDDYQMDYYSDYISTGFSTGYTWIRPFGRLGVATSLHFIWEYAVYDPSENRPHNTDIQENLYTWLYNDSLLLRLSWDTRDVQFDPNKGFILSENLTFTGLLPASRRDYIKSVSRFNYNLLLFDLPLGDPEEGKKFKSVLSFNTAFQALFDKPWTTIEADPQRDGFYIDGMFIARGWDTASGFRYLWDNSLQIKFPIVPNILAFDLFFDGVGAWKTKNADTSAGSALRKMHIHDWRFSLGAGLRFANPQFPIGIYLVKKFQWDLNKEINWNPEPDSNEFQGWNLDLVIAFSLDIY